MTAKPTVCIPCNITDYNGSPGHIVRDTYVRALIEVTKCTPLFLPASGRDLDLSDIIGKFDGILLTGSRSHVAPACYGAAQVFEDKELDLDRDATTLPLIRLAVEKNIPLLAICRGFQELNVAMGGTLHQRVHEIPGMMDHRAKPGLPVMEVYETQAHKVTTQKGGVFERIGMPSEFTVNTVHQQGADKIGQGLHVEAIAPDGLVEAVSLPSKRFVLGTQWHPEGDYRINPSSTMIFKAYGDALRG